MYILYQKGLSGNKPETAPSNFSFRNTKCVSESKKAIIF